MQIFAVFDDAFFNLGCEFACGDQHQCTDRTFANGRLFARGKQLQNGQGKTSGLACAGLCACEQVATGEDGGYSLSLYGGWFGVTAFVDGTEDFFGQTER